MGSEIQVSNSQTVLFTGECHATLDGPDGWSSGWLVDGHRVLTRLQCCIYSFISIFILYCKTLNVLIWTLKMSCIFGVFDRILQ